MTMRSGRQIAGRLIATPEPAEVPEAVNNGKPTVTKNFGIQIEKTNNYKALVLNSLGAKSSTGIAEAEFILYNIRYGLEEGGTTKHALVAESSRLMELLAIKGFDRRSNDKENDQVNHLQNSDRECLGYSKQYHNCGASWLI